MPSVSSADAPSVGDLIEYLWPLENQYYAVHVTEVNTDGAHVVVYNDADIESLKIVMV